MNDRDRKTKVDKATHTGRDPELKHAGGPQEVGGAAGAVNDVVLSDATEPGAGEPQDRGVSGGGVIGNANAVVQNTVEDTGPEAGEREDTGRADASTTISSDRAR